MKALDQFQLARLVGASAAFMLFGQAGACVGKTFNLSRPNGRSVVVTMTTEGARVSGATEKQVTEDSDDNLEGDQS